MSRIPGTALHDDDSPPIDNAIRTIESLTQKILFYESVMAHQPPHHQGDRPCQVAEANGLSCCNSNCNGQWGTGCWCCHFLSFAQDADAAQMAAHLSLAPAKPRAKEESDGFKRQATIALAAIDGLFAKFPGERVRAWRQEVEARRSGARDREPDRGWQGGHPRALGASSGMAMSQPHVIPGV